MRPAPVSSADASSAAASWAAGLMAGPCAAGSGAGLTELIARQAGVVATRQLLAAGLLKHDIDRLLRRRQLARIHPGVMVTHTGVPTWEQRCWAAILYAGRSALHLDCALADDALEQSRAERRRGVLARDTTDQRVVQVAIDARRRVRPQPGLRIHRVRDLEPQVLWLRSPPRMRPETAAVACAMRAAGDADAIAELTRVVRTGQTRADRLVEPLARSRPGPRRRLLEGVVADVAAGTHSTLEQGYLDRVLRPHRLPMPDRQVPGVGVDGGRTYRDTLHFGRPVELDGAAAHAGITDQDADRDLADLAAGSTGARLRWGQVYGTPCRTARLLAVVFGEWGWRGRARPCGPGCEVPR